MNENAPQSEPVKPKRLIYVDADTGEIAEAMPVLPRLKINHFKKDYLIMFQDMLDNIVTDKTIKMEELRVYLFVLSKTAMGNWLHMTQKEIGERLDMKPSNICKAFKSLTERGILENTVQLGKSKAYRISPEYVWRGPGAEYSKEMKKRTRSRGTGILRAVK